MEFSFLFIFACVLYLLLRELFSSCSKRGLAVAAHGLLIVSASLIEEHELQGARASVVVACWLCICSLQTLEHRLSGCSSWVWLLHGMWDLPRPGVKPVSPALAGGFLTPGLPGNFLLKRGVSYMCDADSILLQHSSVTMFRDPRSKAGDVTQKMENTGDSSS